MSTDKQQSEALSLADKLEQAAANGDMGRKPDPKDHRRKAAAELRRLDAENAALREALTSCVEYGSMTGGEWVIDKARPALTASSATVQAERDSAHAENYRLIRRGQRWSVVDGIGNTLRGDDLDAAVEAIRAARASKGEKG